MTYKQSPKKAWADGKLSAAGEKTLKELRTSLGISEEQREKLEKEAKLEGYTEAVREAWANGNLTSDEIDNLEALAERFDISSTRQKEIERAARKEFQRK